MVKAAAELSYAHGFGNVALADIADRAGVSLGNLYYYFRTKASIGEAVIEQRCAEFEGMCAQWSAAPTPQDRLKAYVRMTADKREYLARAGCPAGSLCVELGKQEGPLADQASRPFSLLLTWIEEQFEALGHSQAKGALARHLVASVQGICLLANCFRDASLVETEATILCNWIDALKKGRV
jgi:TetR/AcrR family transcriptional regulator, transcriptional repressor for nem operon